MSDQQNNIVENKKAVDEIFCSSCGGTMKKDAEICVKCGVKNRAKVHGKSHITAALLALFLGSFGAHKFYMNKVGLGILYLVFCWSLIPSLIAFIECIIYFTMNDETFNEKYIR